MKNFAALRKMKDIQNGSPGGKELPRAFFQKLLQNCWVERYDKGDYIINKGDIGKNFYIIIDGDVSSFDRNEQKEKALAELNLKKQATEIQLSANEKGRKQTKPSFY